MLKQSKCLKYIVQLTPYTLNSVVALKECPAYEETKFHIYEEVDAVKPCDENRYSN